MDKPNSFEPDKILEKKWFPSEKKFKYKVNFKGFSESDFLWIDSDNKICKNLIQRYEESMRKNDLQRKKKIIEDESPQEKVVFGDINIDIPSKLVGIKRNNSELLCLVEWEKKDRQKSIVKYDVFKNRFPYLVLEFYEKRLKFIDKKDS